MRIFSLLIFTLFLLTWRLFLNWTDGFYPEQISFSWPFEVTDQNSVEEETLSSFLKQPFHYLGKGAQTYAFLSRDETVVLKFFKMKHLLPSFAESIASYIPFLNKWSEAKWEKKRQKVYALFLGYQNAIQHDKENSGLIFFFPKGYRGVPPVEITDKAGRTFIIDLSKTPFVLQKKGIVLHEYFTSLLEKGDLSKVLDLSEKVLESVYEGYQNGVHDRDHGVMRNLAFDNEEEVLRIDVGKLSWGPQFSEPAFYKDHVVKVASVLKGWLDKETPSQKEEIETRLRLKLENLLHETIDFKDVEKRLSSLRGRDKKHSLPTLLPSLPAAPSGELP